MLINGQHAEELRMAITEDNILETYRVEVEEAGVERGNIYRGVVCNIEPSLDAAFIEYGADRHGFLARQDVVPQAYHRQPPDGVEWPRIEDVLCKGEPILVQVTRDAVGSKGAALTTNVSLAGRYLVLMPFDTAQGMSRKVEDEDLRRKLKDKVKSLVASEGFGFIVRTNAVDETKTALKADLDALVRLWRGVSAEGQEGLGPRLLHNDQDLVLQALRDHLDAAIDEVIIDHPTLHAKATEYLAAVMPRSKVAVTLYAERIPLFSRFNLEPQVAAIYKRVVPLPSGGSLAIDPTEALIAVDVNSGRATSGASQEETAHQTNLEAAVEVARQLRLRDIGGIIVVDFIDMRSPRARREVEKTLKDAMKRDKARFDVGHISGNGLLEINRQRIGQALQLRTHRPCPTCQGVGRLLAPELLGLHLLRRIEAGAATGRQSKARIALHPQVAEVVQNRRRAQLAALEAEYKIQIALVASPDLAPSEDKIQWTEREPAAEAGVPGDETSEARAPREEAEQRKGSRPERGRRDRGRPERGRPEGGRSELGRREGRRTRERPKEAAGKPVASEPEAAQPMPVPVEQDRAEQPLSAGPPESEPLAAEGKLRRRRRRGRNRAGAPAPAVSAGPTTVQDARASVVREPRLETEPEGARTDGAASADRGQAPAPPGAQEATSRRRRRRHGSRPAAPAVDLATPAAAPVRAAAVGGEGAEPRDPNLRKRRRRRGGRGRRGAEQPPEEGGSASGATNGGGSPGGGASAE
jgi:ribonuclease E